MDEIPLHHVYTYNAVDRAFWREHLEDWLPRRIVDAHFHFIDPCYQIETITEEMRRQYWVLETNLMPTAEVAEHCVRTTFPGREVQVLAFGFPTLGWDIEASNEYVRRECLRRGWRAMALTRPTWVAEQVAWLLDQPGVIGIKPFYSMIGYSRQLREGHLEADILDFLPHHQLEVINERRAWVVLHVPKADRLGHPSNQRQIREIRRLYPDARLVIAHLGRCYTRPHAEEGLLPLADDPGLYFDNSAVINPDVHELALRAIGPERIVYGSDNPVFYMRGRRQWRGRTYINRTSHPFHFNTEREPPEVEARYTLYMYEALRGIKTACERLGLGRDAVEAIFHGNAERIVADIESRKPAAASPVHAIAHSTEAG
ncbi:MAG TPA: amidohydrolase family protein [Candidatus Sumerlaeota bacterium]|nr:MAG: Amidohydrolase [candidate division BRC1 bacterium ADurb.BinA292]HOE97423.1 amidohydrolase family protein [Candidatus Sumerlaeota bacterium]HOR28333.1 amidohydrolase family protein [Candidatus Sumerlaeota bacterium]HPK01221.1 amidohydrolase family protein [Candidatus Sumerlaeota bacterium]